MPIAAMPAGQTTPARQNSSRSSLCGCFSQTVAPTNSPLASPVKPAAEPGKLQDGVVDVMASGGDCTVARPASVSVPELSTSGRLEGASLRSEDACLRWAVSSAQWDPVTNGEEWLFLLDLLPEEDQKQVRLCSCY